MRDITHKQITLRTARAAGIVFCSTETIELVRQQRLPKGNLFDVARAAGFLGAKQTPNLLPHCHIVSIDAMDLHFDFLDIKKHNDLFAAHVFERPGIVIQGEAQSIGRTGIEMEILTAVSVAALEIYDMLKPLDKGLEIGHIRLLEKKGGKSDRSNYMEESPPCAVLVCSDSTAAGQREDQSGKMVIELLEAAGGHVKYYEIVPDQKEAIQTKIMQWVGEDIAFVFTTGGTGPDPRDVTVTAVREILEKIMDGIPEAMRSFGQMRTPLAMMSSGIAGTIGQTLIVTLPGSTGGARESLEAILPAVFHAQKILKGNGH